jgi:two-component system, chemotaxis family, protein-glutamate methylesterase/glutaminase
MSEKRFRALIVDDSIIFRTLVQKVLERRPDIEIVGVAQNGHLALDKIARLKPDIVTLDVVMPDIDGLEVLRRMRAANLSAGVIMLSGITGDAAGMTISALSAGAFDFVPKPCGSSAADSEHALQTVLFEKIDAFIISRGKRTPRLATPATRAPVVPSAPRMPAPRGSAPRNRAAVIASSTGGPPALGVVMRGIAMAAPTPIFIVQHMPPVFTKSLADSLSAESRLHVVEAADGMAVRSGEIYLAPGGFQMKVVAEDGGLVIRINSDPPENSCRPAADYTFRSVVQIFGAGTLGVVLTGMGNDGALGCRDIKKAGGRTIAQDEASCVVYGMPKRVIDDGNADVVAPLDRIGDMIRQWVNQREVVCV